MTWLPLVYASKMLDVPLMLFTFSKYNPKSFGVAAIETMGKNYGLNYKENPPNKNTFRDIDNFKRWLRKNMNIEV